MSMAVWFSVSRLALRCAARRWPNPSLHLTFASRLRRLSPAGELKR